MQNYFEREITTIEKELRWLKTSAVKSGSVVSCAIKSVQYNIPLTLVSPTNATGSAYYKLSVAENSIFSPTLDVYYDDITVGPLGDTRRRSIDSYCLESGVYILRVGAWGNSSDRSTLSNGGSVTISGTLTVTCTDDFTLEVVANGQ